MRSSETITMVTLVPSFFVGGDHKLEIRIGSKGSVGQVRGMRWGWECHPSHALSA
jgi:hypothetical protein